MTIPQTIHHKKNEIQEVEFFADKECTEDFDFNNADVIYLERFDVNLLFELSTKVSNNTILIPNHFNTSKETLYYLKQCWLDNCPNSSFIFLDEITPNLSKYIPEDNAVLFLSEQDMEKYKDCFPNNHISLYTNDGSNDETFIANNFESLISGIVEVKKGNTTIFLPHGTQSELQKAEEFGKYLWENFRIKPNLYVLHCFVNLRVDIFQSIYTYCECVLYKNIKDDYTKEKELYYINKIITTNSTGILKPENSTERLQVVDAKEIFEEYLETQR